MPSPCRVSLGVQMLHLAVDGGALEGHTTDLVIKFDGHNVVSVSNLMTKFPYVCEEVCARRNSLVGLKLKENPTV